METEIEVAIPELMSCIRKSVQLANNLKSRMDTLEDAFEVLAKEVARASCDAWRKPLGESVMAYKQSKEYV